MTPRHTNPSASTLHPRAYSLIELVLALALIALLMLGAQSAILLSSKALPDKDSPEARRLAAAQALDVMTSDLADAVSITRARERDIEFTVPDRDGDGQPESIRYTDPGVSGGQLRRVYNGSIQTLIKQVAGLTIAYGTRDTPETVTLTEGAEVLLASNDTGLNPAASPVNSLDWIGTTFRPPLPADATSWTLTRVKIRTRSSGGLNGRYLVQVRPAIAGLPTGTVLDEVSSVESVLLPTFAWQDLAFPRAPRFKPGDSAAITVQWAADTQACEVEYQDGAAALGNAALATTTNAGSSWTADASRALFFYAYGRVSSPTPPTYSKRLAWVRVSIDYDTGARMERTTRVHNEPVVILQ
jgi:prepilin-type N-terminal cleavage/methylation domain-containing protein